MSQSRLTARIRAANEAGRKALIPFLPAGFPDQERFWKELESLDAHGADIIEIGVPFSDPVADGPVVEAASLDCLEAGVCLSWILAELKKRKGSMQAAVVLMGYYNPFLQYGLQQLATDAADAGVSGFIVPDLPLEEAVEFKGLLAERKLDLVPLVGLNTSPERLVAYGREATGFVYVVSVLGTTGVREGGLPGEIKQKLEEVRRIIPLPVALGFGIREPSQLQDFGDRVDAVVFGSALINHMRLGGNAEEFMAKWA